MKKNIDIKVKCKYPCSSNRWSFLNICSEVPLEILIFYLYFTFSNGSLLQYFFPSALECAVMRGPKRDGMSNLKFMIVVWKGLFISNGPQRHETTYHSSDEVFSNLCFELLAKYLICHNGVASNGVKLFRFILLGILEVVWISAFLLGHFELKQKDSMGLFNTETCVFRIGAIREKSSSCRHYWLLGMRTLWTVDLKELLGIFFVFLGMENNIWCKSASDILFAEIFSLQWTYF